MPYPHTRRSVASAALAGAILAALGGAGAPSAGAQLSGPQTSFTVNVPDGSVLSDGFFFNTNPSSVVLAGDDTGFTLTMTSLGGKVFTLGLTPSSTAGVFAAGVTEEPQAGAAATATHAAMTLTEAGGPACTTTFGEFRIADLVKSASSITSLAMHYRLTCAGNAGNSAFGTIVVNQPVGPLGGVTPSEFVSMPPVRLLDTRTTARIGPGGAVDVDITANGSGVPTAATAVVLNVTGIAPDADTFLTLFPTGSAGSSPMVSNVNLRRDDTVANLVTVKVGTDHLVRLFNDRGTIDAVIDVVGFYLADDGVLGNGRARFSAAAPVRALDTRATATPLAPGEIREIDLGTTADAALINITATEPTAGGFLTVFTAGQSSPPLASNVNFVATQTVANSTVVKLDGGKAKLYNPVGSTHVVIDLLGTFRVDDGSTTAGKFVAITPKRVYDSRSGFQSPVLDRETRSLDLLRLGGVFRFEYGAFVANITATNTTGHGFFLAYPASNERPGVASNLNWAPGETRANQLYAGVGSTDGPGDTFIYHEGGQADLIIDVAGYFTT